MITVIIPAYNAGKTIQPCIESVLRQNSEVRIILADDGSTDNTLTVAQKYSEQIQILSLHHGGVSSARNAGLDAADGQWIVFLDADDVLMPDALAKMEVYMTEDVDAVCGAVCRGNEKCKTSGRTITYPAGHDLMDYVLADPTNYLTLHAWAFRRKENMPHFDLELRIGEDSDWVLQYLFHASRNVVFTPLPVYRYTVSADSAVHRWRAGQEQDYLKMLTKLSRGEADKEKNWPLFVLTNYLLILTHAVFHPGSPDGRKNQFKAAHSLRSEPVIRDAFDRADLKKLGDARRIVLEFLKRDRISLAYLAVKIRQKQNEKIAEKTGFELTEHKKHRSKEICWSL